jgi:two-component system, NtrC family, sensor kinase
MNVSAAPRLWPSLSRMVAIALIYYTTAKLGQYLAIPPGFITPVYAPSGIAVAVLLRWGSHLWPGIWMAALVAAAWPLWANTGNGAMSLASGLGIALGSVLQAGVGARLLRRWIGTDTLFKNAQNVFKFAGIELLSCMISPTVGSGTMLLCGLITPADFLNSWVTFWLGDYVGVLVIAPLLLIWAERDSQTPATDSVPPLESSLASATPASATPASATPAQIAPVSTGAMRMAQLQQVLEVGLWLVIITLVGGIAFGMAYPIEYMLVPLLVWGSLRFGQRLTTGAILLVAAIALGGTIHGSSSFNRSTLNETLLLLQAFIGAMTLTTMVLSAAIVERESAKAKLKQANTDLESKVADRTAELQRAKNQLENQVQERTASLSQALAELTHTHESLKHAQLHLVQSEKMSSLGQLVAGLAHEINNPINFIYGNITHTATYAKDLLNLLDLYQAACGQPTPEIQAELEAVDLDFLRTDLLKILASMQVGADRIKQIILSLRNFSRLDESAFKAVNIHDGIDNTLAILDHQFRAVSHRPKIQVIKTYSELPLVECYAGQLNQVFMNLLVNAIEALDHHYRDAVATPSSPTPSGPTIRIHTELQNQHVTIRIADNGPGIAEEIRQHIFNPFFTTKSVGQGTGLGLSISYQIITERHQGLLTCQSHLGEGTEFKIQIPV